MCGQVRICDLFREIQNLSDLFPSNDEQMTWNGQIGPLMIIFYVLNMEFVHILQKMPNFEAQKTNNQQQLIIILNSAH